MAGRERILTADFADFTDGKVFTLETAVPVCGMWLQIWRNVLNWKRARLAFFSRPGGRFKVNETACELY
jgi:hypothetical protein